MITSPAMAQFPVLQSHLQTQLALFSDVSNKLLDAVQQIAALNIQVGKTMFAESVEKTTQMAALKTPADIAGHLSGLSQPATSIEKFQAYQQHLQRIFAGTAGGLTQGVAATQESAAAGVTQPFVADAMKRLAEESAEMKAVADDAPADTTASIIDSLTRVAKTTPAPTV